MPLNLSSAQSSRISKRSQPKTPLLRRSASSPFNDFIRRKPIQRSKSKADVADDDDDDFFGDRLDDIGIVKSLASDLSLRDLVQITQYVRSHMFESMPENGGFNSTRIADILNFRKSLPPTVTVNHIHALAQSPTITEREIAELTRAGTIRRLVTPGRGTGGSSIGESLILSKDVEGLLREARDDLDQNLAEKYLVCLRAKPMALSVSSSLFSAAEITALMRAGFLTSVQSLNSANVFAGPDSGSSGTLTSISTISKAASGSLAAVGGEGAIYGAGGRGGLRRSSSQLEKSSEQKSSEIFSEGVELRFSVPNMGAELKLLTAARSHLVSLVMKSRFREIPVYLLRERWDGGIAADDPAAKAKKYRGEFTGVLSSRTRKWKQFYGLSFDWALAECLGAGLVEVFETGSVGQALGTACLISWPLVNDLVKESSDQPDRIWAGFKMFYKTRALGSLSDESMDIGKEMPRLSYLHYFAKQVIDTFICQVHSHLLKTVETVSAENWEVGHDMDSGNGSVMPVHIVNDDSSQPSTSEDPAFTDYARKEKGGGADRKDVQNWDAKALLMIFWAVISSVGCSG